MSLPERKAVPEAHQWDLTSLYASASEWTEEFAHFENAAHEVSAFRSTLKESAQKTGEAFRCCLELSRVAERLYTYAHLL
ncbi:MAG TPA: oligoendopeptidase F, partial [Oligoflexia bacterium]|nr:oligoendopeptidase F [Oligoflexia bacterium]